MNPQANDRRPLGLLGGTFDPIHIGHLHLAETARDHLRLGEVCFIPAGTPPHRTRPQAPGADRLAMVRLAVADNPSFSVDDREVTHDAPSFTVPTLEALRQERGTARPFVLLLGLDAFLGLPTWHRWRTLFDLAHIAIANRPGFTLDPHTLPDALANEYLARAGTPGDLATSPAGRMVPFDITPLSVSATQLRALLTAGDSARYLCPNPVLDYIAAHHLYR